MERESPLSSRTATARPATASATVRRPVEGAPGAVSVPGDISVPGTEPGLEPGSGAVSSAPAGGVFALRSLTSPSNWAVEESCSGAEAVVPVRGVCIR
ncbi:hypothetical protein SMICM17S_05968 [Streptomyces microflavus]